MRYLNLGCGYHYSNSPEWTNLDFESTGPGVIGHNLLSGIPFGEAYFDLVYHSHVLEHFSKSDGERLLAECFRVLKPGGVIRIAIPDLEGIVRNYLKFLEAGIADPSNPEVRANYEWMLLEMYDQTVRNQSGGNMGKYLASENMINEAFVFSRIGEEGRAYRKMVLAAKGTPSSQTGQGPKAFLGAVRQKIKQRLLEAMHLNTQQLAIGQFRTGGEIHQWMYDRYSLMNLLGQLGGRDAVARDAYSSYLPDWASYSLDAAGNEVRKPDSLFMEAIKA
jgi:predicted SAM-dependent methyltransferase